MTSFTTTPPASGALAPRIVTLIALAFALGAPAVQALTGWGLSPSEFSRSGNSTLRVAGYAFSIWSLIYLGLIAYGVFQALPGQAARPLLNTIRWPAAAAIFGCGAWICASALDARWASVLIIVGSAAILTQALVRASDGLPGAGRTERLFVWWPLGLLAGWLTIASAVNVLTVLTAANLLGDAATAAALVGVAVVVILALAILRRTRLVIYALPIVWGLVGAWVAERTDQEPVANVALGAAIAVAGYALWQAIRGQAAARDRRAA